ncbi:MAG: haloacid dehalogenase-like hydrolase [Candidatus Dormibacteraeota bacterium]|nr:haloacid dehalogenase-like hydrolase [Candidatus Dormibacteraeota bacterium]
MPHDLPPTRLVLWDIDLTLVEAGSFGRELYGAAFRQVTGRPMEHLAPAAGRLDPDIYRDTLAGHDLDPASHPFPAFAAALAAAYTLGMAELSRHGRALPGAVAALAALAGTLEVVQSVVTGNVAAVARIKLTAFGLDRQLDLEIGAYGPEARLRSDLVRLARWRAGAKHGVAFEAARTVLIGDTTHDVDAGRDGGARVIAVASGRMSAEQLRAAGAGVVLADLTDTGAVLRAVLDRPA